MSNLPDDRNAGSSPTSGSSPAQTGGSLDQLKSSWRDPAKRPLLLLGFGAVGVAGVLLVIALAQLLGIGSTPPAPAPTPTPACTGANCVQAQPQNPVPKKLYVRDREFEIEPVAVPKGKWIVGAGEGKIEWVFGSVVNVLLGLPNTTENADLLQALSVEDKITLELADGQRREFTFDAQQRVSPDNKAIFSQQHPGLTLILLGDDGEQRLVVTANYDASSEGSTAAGSNLVAINTPVEIGPVRVKVLNGRLVENAPGIPVGSAFYLVDFAVENIGEDVLNSADFGLELQDYARQKYKVSDTASKLGPNPAPAGQLLPGLGSTFTVGFEVPSNITGPILTWIFKPTPKYSTQANVVVPLLGPTPTPEPRAQAQVQVTQAYFTPDQSELIFAGSIANPTNVLIPVSPSDFVLSTPDGVLATLISAEPMLPWRIAPGESVNFKLHFSRLPSSEAVLKILNSSFGISFQ